MQELKNMSQAIFIHYPAFYLFFTLVLKLNFMFKDLIWKWKIIDRSANLVP